MVKGGLVKKPAVGVVVIAGLTGVLLPSVGASELAEAPPEPVITCKGVPATLVGTNGPDVLEGTEGPDVIVALGGDDRIRSLGGNDLVCAGPGNDRVNLGSGADRGIGGPGHDTIRGASGWDVIIGGPGNDRLISNGGNDLAKGGPGDDVIRGNLGDDLLVGGPGNDVVLGGPGSDDKLRGAGGSDVCADPQFPTQSYPTCELSQADSSARVDAMYTMWHEALLIAGDPSSTDQERRIATTKVVNLIDGDPTQLRTEVALFSSLYWEAGLDFSIDQSARILGRKARLIGTFTSFGNPTQLDMIRLEAFFLDGAWKLSNRTWGAFVSLSRG